MAKFRNQTCFLNSEPLKLQLDVRACEMMRLGDAKTCYSETRYTGKYTVSVFSSLSPVPEPESGSHTHTHSTDACGSSTDRTEQKPVLKSFPHTHTHTPSTD